MGDHDMQDAAVLSAQLSAEEERSLEAKTRLATALEELQKLRNQVNRLGLFISRQIPGEPSKSEGACACAVRIMSSQAEQLQHACESTGRNEARARYYATRLRAAIEQFELMSDPANYTSPDELRTAASDIVADIRPDPTMAIFATREGPTAIVMRRAIAFLREAFKGNDGAEGDSVKLLCDFAEQACDGERAPDSGRFEPEMPTRPSIPAKKRGE